MASGSIAGAAWLLALSLSLLPPSAGAQSDVPDPLDIEPPCENPIQLDSSGYLLECKVEFYYSGYKRVVRFNLGPNDFVVMRFSYGCRDVTFGPVSEGPTQSIPGSIRLQGVVGDYAFSNNGQYYCNLIVQGGRVYVPPG